MSAKEAYVRVCTENDLVYLSENLRKEDIAELKAHTTEPIINLLKKGYRTSDIPLVVIYKENPIAIFGVVRESSNTGRIWMVATDDLKNVSRRFLRECHGWIQQLMSPYDMVWNIVDTRNELHIKWLKWCQFIFISKFEGIGRNGESFYQFFKLNTQKVL